MPLEEFLRPLDARPGHAVDRAEPFEEPTTARAADPVADVVADDGRGGRDRDHLDDFQVAPRGEDRGRNESRLAGDRDAAGLEHHRDKERGEPVMMDQVGQRGTSKAIRIASISCPPLRK